MANEIVIPYNFIPRDYQLPPFQALDSDIRRALLVWHRRAGKDKTVFNITVKKALERVGVYYYFFPTYNQGRKILWDGFDRDGFKTLGHCPDAIIKAINNQEMKITLINGSIIQVIGTDNIDSIVGTNPIGCVFSEYSLQNPAAWNFIRPILLENGGWALFVYTPRGKNHGHKLYQMAKDNPKWFVSLLTVDDTGAIDPGLVEEERNEGMPEELVQQEYYCSFEAGVQGGYYTEQLRQAVKQKRIGRFAYDPDLPVHTGWDIGISDATAIWFFQVFGGQWRWIHYFEDRNKPLTHYVKYVKDIAYAYEWVYGKHIAPHDMRVREFGSGKRRTQVAEELGLEFEVAPQDPVDDGIDAVMRTLAKSYIDEEECEQGLNCLWQYHREYDDKRAEFKNKPVHDWSSHGCDAMRTAVMGFRDDSQFSGEINYPKRGYA